MNALISVAFHGVYWLQPGCSNAWIFCDTGTWGARENCLSWMKLFCCHTLVTNTVFFDVSFDAGMKCSWRHLTIKLMDSQKEYPGWAQHQAPRGRLSALLDTQMLRRCLELVGQPMKFQCKIELIKEPSTQPAMKLRALWRLKQQQRRSSSSRPLSSSCFGFVLFPSFSFGQKTSCSLILEGIKLYSPSDSS